MPVAQNQRDILPINATISSGQSESDIIRLFSSIIGQIYIPNTFEGKKLTYNISYDGITFFAAKNINNAELSICDYETITNILAGSYCIASNDLNGVRWLKLKSDTIQSQDCIITLAPRLK